MLSFGWLASPTPCIKILHYHYLTLPFILVYICCYLPELPLYIFYRALRPLEHTGVSHEARGRWIKARRKMTALLGMHEWRTLTAVLLFHWPARNRIRSPSCLFPPAAAAIRSINAGTRIKDTQGKEGYTAPQSRYIVDAFRALPCDASI